MGRLRCALLRLTVITIWKSENFFLYLSEDRDDPLARTIHMNAIALEALLSQLQGRFKTILICLK